MVGLREFPHLMHACRSAQARLQQTLEAWVADGGAGGPFALRLCPPSEDRITITTEASTFPILYAFICTLEHCLCCIARYRRHAAQPLCPGAHHAPYWMLPGTRHVTRTRGLTLNPMPLICARAGGGDVPGPAERRRRGRLQLGVRAGQHPASGQRAALQAWRRGVPNRAADPAIRRKQTVYPTRTCRGLFALCLCMP